MTARSVRFERYAADGMLVLGGLAALLLQVGDPVVARGVTAHSTFARDPLERLRRTLGYVYAVEFGTPRQRRRAASLVDRSHTGIPGSTDVDRQLWVAATLVATGIQLHELLNGPIDPALAAEIHEAGADLATALQVPIEAWPTDRAAFDRYWTDAVARLEVGDDARSVAHDLLRARGTPWWTRPAMPLVRTLTSGLLPDSLRTAYGLTFRPARFRVTVGTLRILNRLTPRRLRELPARRLLAQI